MRSVTYGLLATLAACSATTMTTALGTVPGQLFCTIVTEAGPVVAPLIDGAATAALGPIGGAVAVLATDATAADVQSLCQQAAANVGAPTGIPVAPPPPALSSPAPIAVSTATTPSVKTTKVPATALNGVKG